MSTVERVLVVGAGIGGLALARALRRLGIDVEVVEKQDAWRRLGAGLALQPNGARALRELDLLDAVVRAGIPIEHWLFADDQGVPLFDIDLPDFWGDVGPFVGIARAGLHDVLFAGARGARFRMGTSVTRLDVGDDDVSVRLSDGSVARYDLVVGADGLRSTVRGLVFPDVQLAYGGQISWRSIAPVRMPAPPSVQFWLGDRRFFGLCPIASGWTYGFAYVFGSKQHDPVVGRIERLRTRFSSFGPGVRRYLDAVESDEQIHCSTIEWMEQQRWYSGRVVLIGDAAHASSPMMGQGGNMALEDALVLGEVLAAERSVEAALKRYAERRTPRTRFVQDESRRVSESLGLPPSDRNELLRAKGEAMFRTRFAPLLTAP